MAHSQSKFNQSNQVLREPPGLVIYYYRGKGLLYTFGHVAAGFGRENSGFEVYSYTRVNQSEMLKWNSTGGILNDEQKLYGDLIKIKLLPITHHGRSTQENFNQWIPQWKPNAYAVFSHNCSHSIQALLQNTGYVQSKINCRILTPYEVARAAWKVKFDLEREAIKGQKDINDDRRIEFLIQNEIDRLIMGKDIVKKSIFHFWQRTKDKKLQQLETLKSLAAQVTNLEAEEKDEKKRQLFTTQLLTTIQTIGGETAQGLRHCLQFLPKVDMEKKRNYLLSLSKQTAQDKVFVLYGKARCHRTLQPAKLDSKILEKLRGDKALRKIMGLGANDKIDLQIADPAIIYLIYHDVSKLISKGEVVKVKSSRVAGL